MKVLLLSLSLVGCGYTLYPPQKREKIYKRYVPVQKSTTCTVIEVDNGGLISCPDGTTVYIRHGSEGKQGEDGIQGERGSKGDTGERGSDGIDGEDGKDCKKGSKGNNKRGKK